MAKSASRSNKAMNIPINAELDGMTLSQVVAQARGTDQEGSNIGSNQMYERLSTSPEFNNLDDIGKQVEMNNLLGSLPEDNARSSVVNMINITSPNPTINVGGFTLKYGTPTYMSENNPGNVLSNVKKSLGSSQSQQAKDVITHITRAQALRKQNKNTTASNASSARVDSIMDQARDMEINLRNS